MTEEVFDSIGRLTCYQCKWLRRTRGAGKMACKRVDGENIQFVKQTFLCEPFPPYICADFSPVTWCVYACSVWRGFDDYWEWYSKEWIPRAAEKVLVWFCINGEQKINYGVLLMDFVNGTMYDGHTLKAAKKYFYKRNKVIYEDVGGVEVRGKLALNARRDVI